MFRTIIKQIQVWVRKIWSRKTPLANNDGNSGLSPEIDGDCTLETSDEMAGNPSDLEDQGQRKVDLRARPTVKIEDDKISAETSEDHPPHVVNDDSVDTKSAESDIHQDDKRNAADSRSELSELVEQPKPKPEESDKVVEVTESPHSSEDEDYTDHSTTPTNGDSSEAKIKEKENDKTSEETNGGYTSHVVNDESAESDIHQDDKRNAADSRSELSELVEQPKPKPEESDKVVEVTESSHSSEDEDYTDHSTTHGNGGPSETQIDGKKFKQKTPRKIGGRRSSSTSPTQQGENDAEDKATFIPQPELICYKPLGSWQWEIVLSVPQECNIAEVRHNTTPLSTTNGEYRPLSFSGDLSVKYDDLKPDEFPLFDGKTPLIFKLRDDWEGMGRKMRGITQGHFIVIAPGEWTRTGYVPVESEGCADTKYLAHYFFKDKDLAIDEIGGFKECDIALTQTGFQLSGNCVFDDSEDGEFFVGTPPVLEPKPGITWAHLCWNPNQASLGREWAKRRRMAGSERISSLLTNPLGVL